MDGYKQEAVQIGLCGRKKLMQIMCAQVPATASPMGDTWISGRGIDVNSKAAMTPSQEQEQLRSEAVMAAQQGQAGVRASPLALSFLSYVRLGGVQMLLAVGAVACSESLPVRAPLLVHSLAIYRACNSFKLEAAILTLLIHAKLMYITDFLVLYPVPLATLRNLQICWYRCRAVM